MKTYTAEEARPLILNGSLKGEYAVTGSLYLGGCDLTGVTLPVKVGDSLELIGCTNPDPSQWWRERGQTTKRHCLAVSVYPLIGTEDGFYYAGCRGPWTAERALAHWGPRKDERAKLFVKAIKENEERKLK